jgi:hypothetical protein
MTLQRILKWICTSLAVLTLLLTSLVVITTNPEPWSKAEISTLTIGLNEAAAIGVPHGFLMSAAQRQEHLALLTKVEQGDVLTAAESLTYRKIFQAALYENQKFLGRFDTELTPLDDHAMEMSNNIAGLGIAGHHDHHDLSARQNFAAVLISLDRLKNAQTFLGRAYYANVAQKDLVDIISHVGVAPHTVSVAYEAPDQVWGDATLGAEFEAMLNAYKTAQFADIHSPAYWEAVDQALAFYNDLILDVQAQVMAHTSAHERRFAGRFLSLQTLAPPVDLHRALRRK